MKNVFKKHVVVAGLLIIATTAVAWQNINNTKKKDAATNYHTAGDTSQPKQHNNDKDEFGIKELDKAMKQLNIELKNLDLHLKDMNVDISREVNEAIAKIDFEKIGRDVAEEIEKIDLDKIKVEVSNSLKQAQEQLKEIDMGKLHEDMQELQQDFNSGKFKRQIEDAMKSAKEGIEKAKKELRQLKEFTDELQKDGLIDKKKGYSIEWKNGGDLYINGTRQPKEVSDKYRKYYKKDGYKINMYGDDNDDDTRESL